MHLRAVGAWPGGAASMGVPTFQKTAEVLHARLEPACAESDKRYCIHLKRADGHGSNGNLSLHTTTLGDGSAGVATQIPPAAAPTNAFSIMSPHLPLSAGQRGRRKVVLVPPHRPRPSIPFGCHIKAVPKAVRRVLWIPPVSKWRRVVSAGVRTHPVRAQ